MKWTAEARRSQRNAERGPFAEGMESSICHDMNYREDCPYGFTRKEAGDLLLEGMTVCGVPWLRRQTIYRAVRLFGWRYYKPRN
jgi:hypothetical protein